MVIRIPYEEIEIAPEWRVADLATIEAADEALLHLTREIASIDAQLTEFEAAPDRAGAPWTNQDEWEDPGEWARSARSARAIKREIYGLVQKRRVEVVGLRKKAAAETHDRRLLDLIRTTAPEVFATAVAQLSD